MERVQGPQTPFESYCHSCRVTFPAEARRCIHCGGRLSKSGRRAADPSKFQLETAGSVGPAGQAGPVNEPSTEEMLEEEAVGALRRFGGLAVWALIALSALLSNLCRGG